MTPEFIYYQVSKRVSESRFEPVGKYTTYEKALEKATEVGRDFSILAVKLYTTPSGIVDEVCKKLN